jgi:hypothetical protein
VAKVKFSTDGLSPDDRAIVAAFEQGQACAQVGYMLGGGTALKNSLLGTVNESVFAHPKEPALAAAFALGFMAERFVEGTSEFAVLERWPE